MSDSNLGENAGRYTDRNPWELYDGLIEGIPAGIGVKNWSLGRRWSFVQSEAGMGIAMTVGGGRPLGKSGGTLGGEALGGKGSDGRTLELRELAACAYSWCFEEASIGVAAINAFYNTPANNPALAAYLKRTEQVITPAARTHEPSGNTHPTQPVLRQSDIVTAEIRGLPGGKVAVIGHFPHLEEVADTCELTILERNPSGTDLPDPACEYVLPAQDLVIITGITLTNKTLVRLLELSRNARTVIAGPSAVCSPVLFEYGVDVVGGALVVDTDEAKQLISHGTHLPFGHGVEMIRFARS